MKQLNMSFKGPSRKTQSIEVMANIDLAKEMGDLQECDDLRGLLGAAPAGGIAL